MKILKRLLLTLLWIFIPSCLVVLCSYVGLSLGAIPMVILHAPFLYLIIETWKGDFDHKEPAIPQDVYNAQETAMFHPDRSSHDNSLEQSGVPLHDTSPSSEPTKETSTNKKGSPFARYDTYITCPGCGSLVPKGTKRCECGYDLSFPAVKIVRRIAPILIITILILLSCYIGYHVGQESMTAQLQSQYEAGRKAGYQKGYQKGFQEGVSVASSNTSRGGRLIPIE